MSISELSVSEFGESLNGFDEIAIAKQFGSELYDLSPMKQVRALCFVHYRRDGMSDAEAYEAAMTLSVKSMGDFFVDEPDDVMPDEPDSEVGKGV